MLSIIVYGRNDSHGYNLHKRAAISLNALAEVLSHPDDEIIFVDYNTPDDHPTFPEAIQDTLTEKLKKRLRILRVHPDQHLPLRSRTHLVALEPQSRNVGLRRSNPRNRWILFTNTDILVIPRKSDTSLSDILESLPDGFYQTPRFELPEMLWEGSFDRRDPAGNLDKVRDCARRFRLNQMVDISMPMRFDGLGDFQVALRDDLFAIDGFDEKMVLGWHCDSNLAARMVLYRGTVDTLVDKVFAYHCDHTRVAAANNKGRQTRMNDLNRSIWDVVTPFLPDQRQDWGWPALDIEEIRLDRRRRYDRFVAGVTAAIPPAELPFETSTLDRCHLDELTYDIPHTMPFVCDQLVTYPSDTCLMVVGTRVDLLRRLSRAWSSMGFTSPILVPRECVGLPDDLDNVKSAPFHQVLPRAQICIFEFGLATQLPDEPIRKVRLPTKLDKERLEVVERLLRLTWALEDEPGYRLPLPRRIIGLNVISNWYWQMFTDHVQTNLNPFSTQVAAGQLRRPKTLKARVARLRARFRPESPVSQRLRTGPDPVPDAVPCKESHQPLLNLTPGESIST